jgi:predicted nucleotidyltransferase
VFGSYARSEETLLSDIDMLIDYDNSSDDFLDDLDDYIEELKLLINNPLDFITYNGLIKSPDDSIKKEILQDIIWIYQK